MFSCKNRYQPGVTRLIFTIAILVRRKKILLLFKRKGKFGVGKWNGPGGLVEAGESVEKCCAREVLEETSSREEAKDGIIVLKMKRVGYLEFYFDSEPGIVRVCHVLTVKRWRGSPKINKQMIPWLFPADIKAMPTDEMWESDQYWVPLAIARKIFLGKFIYDNPDDGHLIVFKIQEV